MTVTSITDELRTKYGIDKDLKGAVVTEVAQDGAAADKRLEPGDVITEAGEQEVQGAADISTRVEEAKKEFFKVPRIQGTIPHPVQGEAAAGVVMLRPASPGTGVIAGGAARVILEEAGVHDVLSKSLGSANHINVARATIQGLKSLQRPDEIAARRGLTPEECIPKGLLNAYNERNKKPVAADAATPAETGATS